MRYRSARPYSGFTLIEVLIVMGIISILAALVLVAVNPARQFAKANDTQRMAHVSALSSAVAQYVVDNKGTLPGAISASERAISSDSSQANLCNDLVPEYIPALPSDPKSTHKGAGITDCTSAYDTGYTIERDAAYRITVRAPEAESETEISVTR